MDEGDAGFVRLMDGSCWSGEVDGQGACLVRRLLVNQSNF